MLVPDLLLHGKEKKETNLLQESFMACELETLLFPALEKIAHLYLRRV